MLGLIVLIALLAGGMWVIGWRQPPKLSEADRCPHYFSGRISPW